MEDLRNFIEVDNHSALDVGHLKEVTRSFAVRRPMFEEGCTELTIREGPEELTLRTKEVGSKKSVHQSRSHCGGHGPLLVDADWRAFCQAIYKGIEGRDWEGLYEHYKEMSRAAGVRKPNETQKARAHQKMKTAKDRRDDFYDPKTTFLGRNRTRLELWEEHLKDPIVALDKALKCVENSCLAGLLARNLLWELSSIAGVLLRSRSGRATRRIVCVCAQLR